MRTLYELSTNYQNILEIAEMLDEDQLKEALAGLDDEIENKADGYAKVIKELEAQENAIKDEIKRLTERKSAIGNNVKRMKESLQDQMLLMNKRKIKTPFFSFNIQNNPPSLSILDESHIPKRFYEEQDPKLNKRELLKALKDGEELEGVEIKQGESLRIR